VVNTSMILLGEVVSELLCLEVDEENSNEVIHGPELISQHSKKGKNYTK
jgi:hypothetical protein